MVNRASGDMKMRNWFVWRSRFGGQVIHSPHHRTIAGLPPWIPRPPSTHPATAYRSELGFYPQTVGVLGRGHEKFICPWAVAPRLRPRRWSPGQPALTLEEGYSYWSTPRMFFPASMSA